jgi:multidrug resistance efflux pump
MSARSEAIPIPRAQRWREFRIRFLPGLMFVFVGLLVAGLWSQRIETANMTGVVVGVQAELRSAQSGYLTPLRTARFQRVSAGDVIAEVVTTDPRVLEAQLAVVLAEVEMIRMGLGPVDNHQRNQLNMEAMEMELMKQRIDLASANIRLRRAEQELERSIRLHENGLVSDEEFERVRSEHDVQALEVEQRAEMLDTVAERVGVLRAGGGGRAGADEPVGAALRLQEERLRLIEAQLMPVELVAPIDGMVSRVYRNGGEQVENGEPILTIQSSNPDYIVGYLPHPYRLEPEIGMPVVVRARSGNRPEFESRVMNVGVQVEEMSEIRMPTAQPSPATPTGLSLMISLSDEARLRPGELVDLTLRPERR